MPERRPVDGDHVVAVAPQQVGGYGVAVLRHLDERVDGREQLDAAAPEVVGDVGDRRARERLPAAVPLDPGQPVAQLVAGQPRRGREVGAGEPAHRVRAEEPAAGGVLDPLLGDRDAVLVLVDRTEPGRAQARASRPRSRR